ncbi:hypothetical protein [Fusobacterium sp.]|uniref:hypothetical protein n=1 Tax=Fusobacterium sp. TaxID=68766 RepID=UPI0025C3B0FE|nr:hypothetical protein [Fusobacterium sp.]
MTHIYNEKLKHLISLNYDYEDFKTNPSLYYPDWKTEYCASPTKYEYPILDNEVIREMTTYEKYKKGLYTLTKQEVELNGEIVRLNPGQYLDVSSNSIITVEKIEGVRVEWNWDNHIWEELATDLEKVQAQINEYSELDTPSTLKEMGTELANECMNMLIKLRNMAYTLGNPATIEDRDLPIFPKPSEKLKAFKEKFNSIRK